MGHPLLFSQLKSKELDQKGNNWDMKQCTYGILGHEGWISQLSYGAKPKINLLERQREENQRQIFHPLIRSPEGCSTQGWTRMKPCV